MRTPANRQLLDQLCETYQISRGGAYDLIRKSKELDMTVDEYMQEVSEAKSARSETELDPEAQHLSINGKCIPQRWRRNTVNWYRREDGKWAKITKGKRKP